jgi:aspartyl/asparaginyl-tRNA synthetase
MVSPTSVKNALGSTAPIEQILVQGWVRTRRDSKDFSFIELNDGSCLRNLQVIGGTRYQLFRGAAFDYWSFNQGARRIGRVSG